MNNLQVKQAILDKIKSYDRIIVSRHFRPDGDAIGSTKGFTRMLQLTFPEKEIYLINEDYSDYLAFLGGEDEQIADELYKDALAIVLDTGSMDRFSNKKVTLAKEIIKIDHHIPIAPYGDISWVEELRSSTCEMVVDFYKTFKNELKFDKLCATYVYTGMVTDSGRFRFRDVSSETLINASIMLGFGIDTETLYANLYLEDFEYIKFKGEITNKISITENGVAYLIIDKATQEKFNLTSEQASACISFMDSIKGSLIWLAFIENKDGSTRVRLRSRFLACNELGEKYRGGGHAQAAGATCYSDEEIQSLINDADKLLGEFKKNNGGWL